MNSIETNEESLESFSFNQKAKKQDKKEEKTDSANLKTLMTI